MFRQLYPFKTVQPGVVHPIGESQASLGVTIPLPQTS